MEFEYPSSAFDDFEHLFRHCVVRDKDIHPIGTRLYIDTIILNIQTEFDVDETPQFLILRNEVPTWAPLLTRLKREGLLFRFAWTTGSRPVLKITHIQRRIKFCS